MMQRNILCCSFNALRHIASELLRELHRALCLHLLRNGKEAAWRFRQLLEVRGALLSNIALTAYNSSPKSSS